MKKLRGLRIERLYGGLVKLHYQAAPCFTEGAVCRLRNRLRELGRHEPMSDWVIFRDRGYIYGPRRFIKEQVRPLLDQWMTARVAEGSRE